ncbi:MAG: hypothetical protein HFI42_15140 [Lachnospiraceae bacterium]|nr:hypothetical protein [Lachnospiraceae bacterium]MCI9151784.1 hypothetical protein [Lachnospiraceae bacterium]
MVLHDGNGRTGRMILFRECLTQGIVPVIIEDLNRNRYLEGLSAYQEGEGTDRLVELLEEEQKFYREKCMYFME